MGVKTPQAESAPDVLSSKVQVGIIAFFMSSGLVVLIFGLTGWYSMSQLTGQASLISQSDLPWLTSLKETHSTLDQAQLVTSRALEIQAGPTAQDQIAVQEAVLRQSQARFDAYAAAMAWGSDSPAFARSGGGIDRYEWQKLNAGQPQLVMKATDGVQSQLAAHAGIYFDGFSKHAAQAVALHKDSLQLAAAGGKVAESAAAEQQSKVELAQSHGLADDTGAVLSNIEKITNNEAAVRSQYIHSFADTSQGALLLIPLLAGLGLLLGGFLFSRSFIVAPLQKLLNAADWLSYGDLSQRIPVKDAGVLGIIIQAFNNLAANLEQRYGELDERAKKTTSELEQHRKSASETQRAMINLLHDAKDLEEQLKLQKANVEKKVIARTKELKYEQARLESSVNSLSIGFILTDEQHNIITLNPRAENILFGSERALLVGNERTFVHPKKFDFADIEKSLKGSFNIRERIDQCVKTMASSEEPELLFDNRFLHIYLEPILDPGKANAIGAVILLEDVTEEKVLQRSRDEFFSIASHELRTPLTAIKGNTSMIQQYYPEQLKDDTLREMVEDIHASSERLIAIVNDFLDVSRLEQGKFTFKYEAFNISKIIESVVYEIDQVSKDKGIFVKMDEKLDIYPLVYADQDRTKQIVYNLVGNAMKFTDKGGITVSAGTEGDLLKIFVRDTGRGIPKDKQSLLFHKFQQAGSSLLTRDTTRGTGLGLYISKLLAENMGGKVALEGSVPDKGTTFSFTLPLATEEQSKASEVVPAAV